MAFKFTNFFRTTLSQSIEAADLTAYISSDAGDDIPTLGVDDRFRAVLWDGDGNTEIIDIRAEVGGTLTIERAKESTSARDWPAGTRLEQSPTAALFEQIAAAIAQNRYVGVQTGTNDITVTLGPSASVPLLTDGEEISWIVTTDNTDEMSLVVTNGTDSTDQKDLVRLNGDGLSEDDLQIGFLASAYFDEANDVWRLKTQTSFHGWLKQINDGPLGNNRARNSRFDAWGASSYSTPASGTETADGFFPIYDGTIGAFTISRQSFTPGQTAVPDSPEYYLRWDQSSAGSASTRRTLREKIPNVFWREGRNVIRKIWAKADATRNVTAKITQHFGSGGSPSADVVVATETWELTTSWQAFDIVGTLPSTAGKTLGSAGDHALFLDIDLPVNVTMTIDFAQDQFEPGTISSDFDNLLPLPTWFGGSGRAFTSFNKLAEALIDEFLGDTVQEQDDDLDAISALTGTGLPARIADNSWALRSLAVGTGLTVTNPAGVAGNPTIDLSSGLVNYHNDPLSVSELASITGDFGTAAFKALGTSGDTVAQPNGANTWSATQTFTARAIVSAAAPELVIDETDAASNAKKSRLTSVAGVLTLQALSDDEVTANTILSVQRSGATVSSITAGALVYVPQGGGPTTLGLGFAGTTNYGFYYVTGDVGFAANGGATASFNTARWQWFVPCRGPSGSAAAPSFSHNTWTDTGMYFIADANIGFSCDGTLRMDLNTTRLLMASGVDIQLNSATAPGSVTSVGFRGVPVISGEKSANFTGVAVDAGAAVPFTASAQYIIPANSAVAHPIGTFIMLPSLNGGGNLTVHPDTGVTLRRGDGTSGTGDRTVPADSFAWIWKRGTNEWYILGTFS